MPLGNQPKALHGYIFKIYSNSLDKLRFFSTLALTGFLPGQNCFPFPLGESKMFCMEFYL